MTGDMISMGIGSLVGVGMINATAGMVHAMPAGTAKDIAAITPGLQSVSLLGYNAGMAMKSLNGNGNGKKTKPVKKIKFI